MSDWTCEKCNHRNTGEVTFHCRSCKVFIIHGTLLTSWKLFFVAITGIILFFGIPSIFWNGKEIDYFDWMHIVTYLAGPMAIIGFVFCIKYNNLSHKKRMDNIN